MSAWPLVWLLALTTPTSKDVPACVVVVVTTDDVASFGIGPEALREAIAREARCEVLDPPHEGAPQLTPQLTLHLDDATRGQLELARPDGSRLVREVTLEDDEAERIQALALIASHMLRNEADELLASLGAQHAPPAETAPPSSSSEPDAHADAAPDANGEVAVETEAAGPPSAPVVRMGLGASMSSVPRGGGVDATFVGGLEVALTPAPWLAVGLRDVGGGGLSTRDGWTVGGAPFAELAWRLDADWALHCQLGVDVRVLGGVGDPRVGVAPSVAVGGRVYLLRELSLAAQTGLHVVATQAWATSLHVLPQAAILWSGGLSIALHL